ICPVDETVERAKRFTADGFRILKLKGGNNPEEDARRLIKVAEELGDGIRLRFDANQGYSRSQALEFLKAVEDIPLELLEQPTGKEDNASLGHIASNSTVPVMADESLLSLMDAFKLA
ncbi:MAG: dipeptide epimerase, partial [Nitrospinaceae bacterium]|nr:dipeptide epimerase [Nitrospinaceae bacterium]NIR57557.1 dipeptide epimerase [Nitrospinaceae bacterium]NIS88027.1 dipeptide epimerase [Nitrospinaceae bacterium]NIT84891.1 dipeptide epimerase [Nitrospinaceae bacterium]NIU47067.1 dipeptide epimerase [Nitrospinaceae bacterium]